MIKGDGPFKGKRGGNKYIFLGGVQSTTASNISEAK